MKQYLFQIKGKKGQDDGGGGFFGGNWQWPPVWTDKVEAESRDKAKTIIEEMYGRKFPTRVMAKDLDSNEFLLTIKEIKEDDKQTISLFDVNSCKHCSKQFKVIEKYQLGLHGGGNNFCCYDCNNEYSRVERLKGGFDMSIQGTNAPIIYKITNKTTALCYIGKTTQVFTLRWYQHFFQGTGTKFHDAIKQSVFTDWAFEVIEIVAIPDNIKTMVDVSDFIFSREMFWINHYNSIERGYNSVASKIVVDEYEAEAGLPFNK